jgi:hypothetical protein
MVAHSLDHLHLIYILRHAPLGIFVTINAFMRVKHDLD